MKPTDEVGKGAGDLASMNKKNNGLDVCPQCRTRKLFRENDKLRFCLGCGYTDSNIDLTARAFIDFMREEVCPWCELFRKCLGPIADGDSVNGMWAVICATTECNITKQERTLYAARGQEPPKGVLDHIKEREK